MKLSQKTLEILKSFNNINPSMAFKPGNIISTIDKDHTMLALANIEEEIPRDFAIYELSKFIGALSAMPNCDIELGDKQLVIKTNNSKINYTYAELSMIKASPYKELPVDDVLAEFMLEYNVLSNVIKVASILELSDITIKSEEGMDDILIYASNEANSTSDNYQIKVGETSNSFKISFKLEHFKLLNRDYVVTVSGNPFVQFKAPDITYWIASKAS